MARPQNLDFFFVTRVCYERFGPMLKPLVPMFHFDLSIGLSGIAEKQVPAKLKLIVVDTYDDHRHS